MRTTLATPLLICTLLLPSLAWAQDTTPPTLTVTSPQRGLQTRLRSALVEGTISDPSGISFFVCNGEPVQVAAGGAFRHLVALETGCNTIELRAADTRGNTTRHAVSVISGSFRSERELVRDAVAVRLNAPAFRRIEQVAAGQIGGLDLEAALIAMNPLYEGSTVGASLRLDARAASFGTPILSLQPQTGQLAVDVVIPQVDVTSRARGRIVGIGYDTTTHVTARRALVQATARVNLRAGVATTELTQISVALEDFDLSVNGLPGFLERLARGTVRSRIEDAIREQVRAVVPAEIDRALAGAQAPFTHTVLGTPVTVRLAPASVRFDPRGASVVVDADVAVPMAPLFSGPGPVLDSGSLITPGSTPANSSTKAVAISVNDDLLNRLGHAAWRGDLLNLRVDQAFVSATPSLPAGFTLDAFLLQTFLPELSSLDPNHPVEVEIRALAPPVFSTRPRPGLLEVALGDLLVIVSVVPPGGQRQRVLTVGIQARVGATARVTASELEVSLAGRPTIQTDVISSLVPLDQVGVENTVDFLVPPLLQLMARSWGRLPLPTHPLLAPRGLELLRDGPQLDFLTLRGDL